MGAWDCSSLYRKSSAKRPFADAVLDCARTGGVVYAPKTGAEHEFLANYAKGFINSNVYVGVSKVVLLNFDKTFYIYPI